MKTFIVTGCNGYIGSHMCHELGNLYPDCVIHGVDKVDKKHLRHLYDFYHHIDLAVDTFSLPKADAIFHFAAYISVEEGEREPFKYFHNNVVGSIRCWEQSLKAGIPNFIFSSTAAVYGQERTTGLFDNTIKETDLLQPTSVYGKSKLMVEEILSKVTDMNVARLRYFNACGRNVRANLYEEHDPETHLIPLLAGNKTATIYGNDWATDDGTCVRDYIHVMDICRAHTLTYRYMEEHNKSVLFNIGSGKGYSVKQVVDKVNEMLHNNEMLVEYKDRRPGDVPFLVADTTEIKNTIGFEPQYTLDDIIKSMKEI